jgi:hypothetical protein
LLHGDKAIAAWRCSKQIVQSSQADMQQLFSETKGDVSNPMQ